MVLDHSRLGHENKLLENKLGRIFLRSTSLLYKFLPTDLGVFKNNLLYFLYFLYITSEVKQYYLSYRTRTECGISRFFKTNCTQSMFGTIKILCTHLQYFSQISRTNHAIICLYHYPQKVCSNFHVQVFQIKLKCHCFKPIKLQTFLMQWYKTLNKMNSSQKHVISSCERRIANQILEVKRLIKVVAKRRFNWVQLSFQVICPHNTQIVGRLQKQFERSGSKLGCSRLWHEL